MPNQQALDQFYADITTGQQSEFNHELIKDNNIYFHATNTENAESILENGFDWENNKFNQCYFGKSFSVCRLYANRHPKTTIFAVNLDSLINDESKQDKFLIEGGEIKVKDHVGPENIIGRIDLA